MKENTLPKIEPLLTPKQVAMALGISLSAAYEWASKGLLPVIWLTKGRRKATWRISQEDLEAWLHARKQGVQNS